MSVELDRELTMAMRQVLAFAQQKLPGSFIVVMSYTELPSQPDTYISKVVLNCEDREAICLRAITTLNAFMGAPVVDMRDVVGRMQ